MPNRLATFALLAVLAVVPAVARGQDMEWTDPGAEEELAPEGAAPAWTPPAPPAGTATAPQEQATPPGQWVYTAQHGWIWMPHADAYTHLPASGWGEPYAYVYSPAYAAWTWVAAPWIWGHGPWPVFGVWGPARFGWYAHGWWRSPVRWHHAPGRPWYPGGGWRAAAPYRAGVVRGGAPLPRFRGGAAVVRGGRGGGRHR